jgi:hypothetical protein
VFEGGLKKSLLVWGKFVKSSIWKGEYYAF